MTAEEHSNYPHQRNGDLYDCPACEKIMADECEAFCAQDEGRCPACGEPVDYCQGHGPSGDPAGYRVLVAHAHNDHSACAVWNA